MKKPPRIEISPEVTEQVMALFRKRLGKKLLDALPPEDRAKAKEKERLEKEQQKAEAERLKREQQFNIYPPSEYSVISRMPDNAHPSYVKEAYRLARLILDGKATTYGPNSSVVPCTDEHKEWAKGVEARCLQLMPELRPTADGTSTSQT